MAGTGFEGEAGLRKSDGVQGETESNGMALDSREADKENGGNGAPIRKEQATGPAGPLTPLGVGDDEFSDSLGGKIKRYFRAVAIAIFKPNDVFAPQKISMAGGKLQYTLSEDVRKIRGEAYDAGLRAGQRSNEKLERYCEGDGTVEGGSAMQIFERGKTLGYNNGFTDGRNERAEIAEEALGTFEDLEEYYNKGPDDVVALIGKKFVKVYDFDDAISVYKRRYGEEKTREMVAKSLDRGREQLIDSMMAGERTKPDVPGRVEKSIGEV